MSREFQLQILDFLGVDTSNIPANAEIQFGLLNAPQSWQVFIFLGIAAIIFYGTVHLYLRELNTCPKRVAIALAVTRVSVLSLLLFAIFLDPAVAHSRKRVIEPYVLVLIDNSASMGHRDYYLNDRFIDTVRKATGRSTEQIRENGITRAELVNELLQRDDGKFLKDLKAKGKLKVIMLYQPKSEDDLSTKEDPDAEEPLADEPPAADESDSVVIDTGLGKMGKRTHLARAIRDAIASVAGSPIAGIVLITDGQDNSAGDDPLAAALFASERTKKKGGVQIFPLAVGDASPPRNLQVVEVGAEDYVWQGDPFDVQATLSANGLGDQTVQVELYERLIEREGGQPGNDQKRLVGSMSVSLRADGTPRTVIFKHEQKTLGRYAYHVRVKSVEHESREDDNERQIQVHVRNKKARVLLIAGGPQWDYRLLQAMLTRHDQFDLSVWLQSMDVNMPQRGNTPITKMPYQKKDLEQYDVILMIDPDPSDFTTQWFDILQDHVDEGGGLLYMTGPKFSNKFLTNPRTRGIRSLLPVRFGEIARESIKRGLARFTEAKPLGIVPENLDRPIMRFDTDAQFNAEIWKHMPGVYWSFPAVKAYEGARVLIEHTGNRLQSASGQSNRPLLVTGEPGAGRVVYVGFNTWRWRQLGDNAEYYDAFWIQTVRFLVEGRVSKSRRRGIIDTGARRFDVGDKITVRATLRDRDRKKLTVPEVVAKLKGPGASPVVQDVKLVAVENRPGEYVGTVIATMVGLNQIAIELEGDQSNEFVRVSHDFSVTKSQVEMRDLRLNRALLERMAKISAGDDQEARDKARVYDVHELDEIVEALPDRTKTIVTISPWTELWDNRFTLILLIGLLGVEWAVRKHYKLM